MEIAERKRKPKSRATGIIVVLSLILIAIIFSVPIVIHAITEGATAIASDPEDEGFLLSYWGNIIGGSITIIGPIVLGIVTLKQNNELMAQNERLVNLEANYSAPIIKANLFGLYQVDKTQADNQSVNIEDVKTLYTIDPKRSFAQINQNQSFVLLKDASQQRDIMIIQIQNLSNYPIVKVKAHMDIEDAAGTEVERTSVRLMNFAPEETQYWSISVPRGDLDHLNAYIKIIELEFFAYQNVSMEMTLFYTATKAAYGKTHNVELLLNNSYSEDELQGVID